MSEHDDFLRTAYVVECSIPTELHYACNVFAELSADLEHDINRDAEIAHIRERFAALKQRVRNAA